MSSGSVTLEAKEVLTRGIKYSVEGLMVAVAAFMIPGKRLMWQEIMIISAVAAATFALLDLFAPAIGVHVRSGAGMGIGLNLVGFPNNALLANSQLPYLR